MKLRVLLSTCAVLLLAASFSTAQAETKQVVRDTSGDVVRAIGNDSCVRSSSMASMDDCGAQGQAKAHTALSEEQSVVYFEFNSAALTAEAKANLETVAEVLKGAQDVASASIVGYADRIGSDAYNVKLSQRRAEAVKDYLVSHGYVDVNVPEIRALGESAPTTKCAETLNRKATIACLAADRRVEIELTYVK